jgi:two-component system, OmpR family, copper resistance phosphate regulon response regulator CusR
MKILLIEDEPSVSSFIQKGLQEHQHEVKVAFDGPTGLSLARQHSFDLIILDVIMPGMNGVEVCRKLRQEENLSTPIIMLTALSSTDDVVSGLDAGADDYISKPFKFKELVARIRAISRRKSESRHSHLLQVADLQLNLDSKRVSRNEEEIKLTSREFALLEYLMKNKGKVVSRVDILENVWEVNFDMGTNVVDVYVNYLRNKVDKPYDKKLIHTVIGMGYILRD